MSITPVHLLALAAFICAVASVIPPIPSWLLAIAVCLLAIIPFVP